MADGREMKISFKDFHVQPMVIPAEEDAGTGRRYRY